MVQLASAASVPVVPAVVLLHVPALVAPLHLLQLPLDRQPLQRLLYMPSPLAAAASEAHLHQQARQ